MDILAGVLPMTLFAIATYITIPSDSTDSDADRDRRSKLRRTPQKKATMDGNVPEGFTPAKTQGDDGWLSNPKGYGAIAQAICIRGGGGAIKEAYRDVLIRRRTRYEIP